jgi:hypothetical protein
MDVPNFDGSIFIGAYVFPLIVFAENFIIKLLFNAADRAGFINTITAKQKCNSVLSINYLTNLNYLS